MGHFNACDNRLITIMSKDRKDRKARTARARVSGPGFGPEKLEPDPDRGIYSSESSEAHQVASCENYWIVVGNGHSLRQQQTHNARDDLLGGGTGLALLI